MYSVVTVTDTVRLETRPTKPYDDGFFVRCHCASLTCRHLNHFFYLRQRRRYRVNAFARVRLSIFLSVSKITQQELSYRKQIARQLRTQYVEGIYRPKYYTVTSKCGLEVTEGH